MSQSKPGQFKDLTYLVFFSLILPLGGSLASLVLLNNWRFEHILGHSIVEILGALVAFMILPTIWVNKQLGLQSNEVRWILCALLAMGLLDIFHAFELPGNNFVWFHSLATLFGGTCFALVCWQGLTRKHHIQLIFFIVLVAVSITIYSLILETQIPAMANQGQFTLLAKFLNITGGIGFVIASIYFASRYQTSNKRAYYLLVAHCLLFAMAAILFELSSLWDAAWWWWHILRFAAYLILLQFFFQGVKFTKFKPMQTLRGKIIALMIIVVLLVTTLLGGLNYARVKQNTLDLAIEGLAAEARLTALKFKNTHESIESDISFLMETPPIQGIISSIQSADQKSEDGSTLTLWRQRLETIFIALMKVRKPYSQLRYLGIADHGKEIVRVDRAHDQLQRVAPERLQNKVNEPYYEHGLKLKPQSFYYSKITYNREHGRIDDSKTPTLRIIAPVFDQQHQQFGMLIVNVDYPKMLEKTYEEITPGKHSFIVNENGDYIAYLPNSETKAKFRFNIKNKKDMPIDIKKVMQSNTSEGYFIHNGVVTYYVRVNLNKHSNDKFISIALQASKKELLHNAQNTHRGTLLLALAIAAGLLIITAYIAQRFSEPLRTMSRNLAKAKHDKRHLQLPTHLQDEVGELARALRETLDELIESEAKTSAILNNANASIISIDEQGIIEAYNPASEVMFGYLAEEAIGKNISMLMPNPHKQQHDQYLAKYIKSGIKKVLESTREVEAQHKNGHVFPIELAISEVKLSKRRLFTGIMRDISERKKSEHDNQLLIEQLAHSNSELDKFAYAASHDLKAPLRVIDNTSRWLEEDLQDLDAESKENLELLRSRVARMERLLDDLLTYSRIGRKTDEQYETVVNGELLLKDIILLLNPPSQITIDIDPNFKTIEVNCMPLKQVLINLISNAIKHHDKDQGNIKISVNNMEDHYEFKVQDDGPGIAPQFHERIFEMFQTLQSRDRIEGSGIGLAIVKKHIEWIGGTLTLASEPGQGCCFTITWPKQQKK